MYPIWPLPDPFLCSKSQEKNKFNAFLFIYLINIMKPLKVIHRFTAKGKHFAKFHWTTNYSDNTITINVVILS